MRRPTIDEAGLWAAWVLFLVANVCPAVVLDLGAWNSRDLSYFPGWACTCVTWPFWLSNAALLFLPILLAFDRGRTWVRRLRWSLAVLFAISLIAALCLLPTFRAVHVGYWLWVSSFLVAAASCRPWCTPKLHPPPRPPSSGPCPRPPERTSRSRS